MNVLPTASAAATSDAYANDGDDDDDDDNNDDDDDDDGFDRAVDADARSAARCVRRFRRARSSPCALCSSNVCVARKQW
jgi:hypothetical protein